MLKVFISLFLLAFATYYAATQGPLFETLANTPVWIVITTVSLYAFGQVFSGIKWWILARASGIDCTLQNTVKAYFMGMFANCFGLGVVGGDLARALLLSKKSKTKALASVVADRVHGLTILSLVGALGGIFCTLDGQFSQNLLWLYVLILLSTCLVSGWFLGPMAFKLIPAKSPFLEKLRALNEAFPKAPVPLLLASLISVLFHSLQLFNVYLMGKAYGVTIPLEYILVAVPLVNIASTLPISWNGLGVRENGFVYFMAPAIIAPTQALAFGAIWLVAVTITSALGGVIAFLTKDFEALKLIKK